MRLWNNGLALHIYGESHGPEIGLILEGIPKGCSINLDELQNFVNRRKSQNSNYSTKRAEPDSITVQSGITDGITSGSIKISIKNTDVREVDYENLNSIPRPSHADYPAYIKYAGNLNMSGGGPFSGRLTAPIVIAGGIASQILKSYFNIPLFSHITSIGPVSSDNFEYSKLPFEELNALKYNNFPVLDDNKKLEMCEVINNASLKGDSIGGVIEGVAFNLPVGWGGPLFDGIESRLAALLFGIPAVKGVEFGAGFAISKMLGSKANDQFEFNNGKVVLLSNNNGGLTGGMTNGMPVIVRVAFKPTPSISIPQKSVNLKTKENVILQIKGRHDVCFVPRAVVVVESALAIALLDVALENGTFNNQIM
ncbi:MAG: chorismate synthase [Christensenellaceae bacterium]|jgi:chorismate synthase|nr:chorismate synthase [Christensenellaceae bacterium]